MIKEYNSFKQFFDKNHAKHRQLVFYSEREIYYQTLGPLIEELLKDPEITCSYITSDPNDPILTHHSKQLFPFYFNSFLKSVFDKIDARCFVFTMPDLNTYHLKKSKHTKEYIYLFHAFSSTHLQYNEKAFDAYDTIFCIGPHHIDEIQKREQLFKLPQKQLLPIGYPHMDTIYQKYQTYQKQFNEKTILIAPTWSMASLFENGINTLLDVLEKTNYRVVVRPHPEFLKRRKVLANSLKKRISNIQNFIWEDQLLSENNLYEADLLITDRSGIAFEYAFCTEHPVLFIDTPFKKHNKNWEALNIEPIELQLRNKIGLTITLDEIKNILPKINELLKNSKNWKNTLIKLREECIYNFGNSAQQGTKYIKNHLFY